jgi:hypothetical protein
LNSYDKEIPVNQNSNNVYKTEKTAPSIPTGVDNFTLNQTSYQKNTESIMSITMDNPDAAVITSFSVVDATGKVTNVPAQSLTATDYVIQQNVGGTPGNNYSYQVVGFTYNGNNNSEISVDLTNSNLPIATYAVQKDAPTIDLDLDDSSTDNMVNINVEITDPDQALSKSQVYAYDASKNIIDQNATVGTLDVQSNKQMVTIQNLKPNYEYEIKATASYDIYDGVTHTNEVISDTLNFIAGLVNI